MKSYLLTAALVEGSDGGIQLFDGDRHGRTSALLVISRRWQEERIFA